MPSHHDKLDHKFADIFAELHALRLIVSEALSLALSYDADPHNTVVLARKDIDDIIERTETTATGGPNAEFRRSHIEKVRSLVMAQLDAIEKRVSRLRRDGAIH